MTLIVCWKVSDSELCCAADSRISDPNSTITDSGAKIFLVPVTTTIYQDGTVGARSHFTYGFAFAGATLPATNTHALVTSITQLLHDTETRGPPALRSVAELYAKIGTFYTCDINSRRNENFAYFNGFVFGFCPTSNKLLLFALTSENTSTSYHMKVDELPLSNGCAFAMGSGAKVYEQKLSRHNVGPLDAFVQVLNEGSVATVGGHPQIAAATNAGVNIKPILVADESNLDQAVLSLLGFNLSELGTVDGFQVGFEATGIGTEIILGRQALRDRGIDPDSGPISQGLQNLASFEAALKITMHAADKTIAVEEVYQIDPPSPVSGDYYFAIGCIHCKTTTPICIDPSLGDLGNPFVGRGKVRAKCWQCGKLASASTAEIKPIRWI